MERYRSGRNGGASKASCRVTGTGVRIPPSPPTFAQACHNERELRLACHAKVVHRSSPSEGGPLDGKANLPKAAPSGRFCFTQPTWHASAQRGASLRAE